MRWNKAWKHQFVDNHELYFLVFFRLMVSLVALIELGSLLPDISLFFAKEGTLIPQQLMYLQTDYFKYLNNLYNFLTIHDLHNLFYKGVLSAYFFALILLFLGLFTRYVALIALIAQLVIFKSFAHFNYGYDNFMTMSLFYAFVFPVGKYFSLDNLVFPRIQVSTFNYRLVLQIHLAIVYFFSGIAKALDAGWWTGESVWTSISSVANNYYLLPQWLLQIIGLSTLFIELTYAYFIFYFPTRKYMLLAIVGLHMSIALVMHLFAFSTLMIVWNIAAFARFSRKEGSAYALSN